MIRRPRSRRPRTLQTKAKPRVDTAPRLRRSWSIRHALEEVVVASLERGTPRRRTRRRTGAFVLDPLVLLAQVGDLFLERACVADGVIEAGDESVGLGLAAAEGCAELRYHFADAEAGGYGGGVVGYSFFRLSRQPSCGVGEGLFLFAGEEFCALVRFDGIVFRVRGHVRGVVVALDGRRVC